MVPGVAELAAEKRLAVHVEDHPLDYGEFEGTIPEGQYCAGSVIIWDHGIWIPEGPAAGYAEGHLSFSLRGEKLKGAWHLVRMRAKGGERGDNWLLIKAAAEFARSAADPDILDEMPESVASGKGIDKIAKDPLARKWASGKQATTSRKRLTPRQRAREPLSRSQAAPARQPTQRTRPARQLDIAIPKGARKREIPDFIEPCLATAFPKPPAGDKWIHEVKFDGYRLVAIHNQGKVTLKTRGGLDWTAKFPSIRNAIAELPVKSAILDGEAVVEDKNGIVVPIVPRASWEEAKAYCRSIAEAMAADNPKRLTATMSKRERTGRIYIDYLRNDRGSTAVAAYSTRTRSEAGISMPLDWNELDTISSANHFTLGNVDRRLQNLQADPWQAMAKTKQRLPRKSR